MGINTYISTYVKDKSQFTIYKNGKQVIQEPSLPYGINIFTNPVSLIEQSTNESTNKSVLFRPINGNSNTIQQLNNPQLTNIEQIELFYVIKFLNLIYTSPGERLMEPDYGVDFQIYPFNTDKSLIINGIKQSVSHALNTYLPNVSITDVTIDQFDQENHILKLTFNILIKPINTITSVQYST